MCAIRPLILYMRLMLGYIHRRLRLYYYMLDSSPLSDAYFYPFLTKLLWEHDRVVIVTTLITNLAL